MTPSTTVRATSSRLPMRASTVGSTNRAPGIALPAKSTSHSRSGRRHGFEQLVDDRVRRHALGLRMEIGQYAMPQDRMRQRADVLEADVVAPARERPCLAAEHEELRRAD